jgi:predicted transcriptional regulator
MESHEVAAGDCRGNCRCVLIEGGSVMATSGKPLSDYEAERLRRLRQAGLSIRDIGKEERVSTRTVQKYLKTDASARTAGCQ